MEAPPSTVDGHHRATHRTTRIDLWYQGRMYVSGRVDIFDMVDIDLFTVVALNMMVLKLGYTGEPEPMFYNYLRPLTSLDEGLYALACEEDVHLPGYPLVRRFKLFLDLLGSSTRLKVDLVVYGFTCPPKTEFKVMHMAYREVVDTPDQELINTRSCDELARIRRIFLLDTTSAKYYVKSGSTKEEYDIWAMDMEHYLEYIDNDVWKVIQNGNSKKRISTGKYGVIRVLPPVYAAEIHAVEKEMKARTILLMAIPKEHMRRFHGMDDAKEIWEAIRTRFGGNANSKKMQKAVLKQHFEAFSISSSEGLEKGYNRFQ
ncbi:hypothetical protein Tco_0099823 [Tanacetum coccineum]